MSDFYEMKLGDIKNQIDDLEYDISILKFENKMLKNKLEKTIGMLSICTGGIKKRDSYIETLEREAKHFTDEHGIC